MNTATVGAAVTPAVIETFLTHVNQLLLIFEAVLIAAVSQPQTPGSKAHGAYLLRRGHTLNPQILDICLPSYCRGNSTIHISVGAASALGEGRRAQDTRRIHHEGCAGRTRAIRTSWH